MPLIIHPPLFVPYKPRRKRKGLIRAVLCIALCAAYVFTALTHWGFIG